MEVVREPTLLFLTERVFFCVSRESTNGASHSHQQNRRRTVFIQGGAEQIEAVQIWRPRMDADIEIECLRMKCATNPQFLQQVFLRSLSYPYFNHVKRFALPQSQMPIEAVSF